jgi:hypothetical protein
MEFDEQPYLIGPATFYCNHKNNNELLANEIKNYANDHNYKVISVSHTYKEYNLGFDTFGGQWFAIVVFEDKE